MNRMERIYSLIEPGRPLWDIGCDHGLLGIRALQERLVPEVYFVDRARAPMERLEKLMPPNIRNRAHILLIDGQKLDWSKVSGTVVISGVGSNTIVKILNSIPKRFRGGFKVVLCAERGHLAQYLAQEGWQAVQYIVSHGRLHRIITEAV
jgi:tRNA A22 N-methylase